LVLATITFERRWRWFRQGDSRSVAPTAGIRSAAKPVIPHRI
jgi:hypothetical protein